MIVNYGDWVLREVLYNCFLKSGCGELIKGADSGSSLVSEVSEKYDYWSLKSSNVYNNFSMTVEGMMIVRTYVKSKRRIRLLSLSCLTIILF